MNSLSLVWSPLISAHSILYGHITFYLHTLLQECSWGIKQGLVTVTCNTEDLVVNGLVCVFLKSFLQHFISEWLTAPTFRACAPLMQVPSVPERPWEGGTWEHEAHVWVGCKLWRRGNNLPCWVYYSKFLDFFPVWGEHSVNRGWRCTGEDMCQVCGHRPLLHKSTMGLAQEWTPPR